MLELWCGYVTENRMQYYNPWIISTHGGARFDPKNTKAFHTKWTQNWRVAQKRMRLGLDSVGMGWSGRLGISKTKSARVRDLCLDERETLNHAQTQNCRNYRVLRWIGYFRPELNLWVWRSPFWGRISGERVPGCS